MNAARRPRAAGRRDDDGVQQVTDAAEPLAVEQARRMRRYLIQMAVRVALFLAAAAAYAWHAPMWVVFATLLGAAVLPYTAVVGANAGRERPTGTASYVTREPLAIGYGVVIDGAEDPTGRDGDHNAPADAADRAAPADAEDRAAPADGADNGRHHD